MFRFKSTFSYQLPIIRTEAKTKGFDIVKTDNEDKFGKNF